MAKLQHFPLAFLHFNSVIHPEPGQIPHQKTFQNLLFSMKHAFFQRSIYILDQIILYLPVQLHIQLQYSIYLKNPLFPVSIRFYLHPLMDQGNLYMGDQLLPTPLTLHFPGKGQAIFLPLRQSFLICPFIKNKYCQLSLHTYLILLHPQVQVSGFYSVP